MRTACKTVYTYPELSESAQAKARDWYREGGFNYEWWGGVYDDARTVAALMGVEVGDIYFSGFWSQGDGACFEGSYAYAAGGVDAVIDYAPKDYKLHGIAEALRDAQRPEFYQLEASVRHRGQHSNSFCTVIAVTRDGYNAAAGPAEDVCEALRGLMQWVYRQLESEYEHLSSDGAVAETIAANEYEFTEDGKRHV